MSAKFLILKLSLLVSIAGIAQPTDKEVEIIDSLKKIIASDVHDTIRISAYHKWDNIIYAYDVDLDVQLNEKMIAIASTALSRSGLNAREIELYLGYKSMAENNLGLILIDYGNYFDALKNFQNSLQVGEYYQDSLKQGNALNNIGMIYKHMGMSEKALEYYERSLEFMPNDVFAYATFYNNAGICYSDMGNNKMALECYSKSLVYADSISDFSGKGNTLSNIGLIHLQNYDYELAINYFNEAIQNYELVNEQGGIAHAYSSIGNTYFKMGDVNKAIDYCQKSLNLATESKILEAQSTSCDCLYESYKKLNKTTEALSYYERYVLFKDSLRNASQNDELIKLDFQFNAERRYLADSLEFANQKELQRLTYETDLAKKEKTQYILYAGIIILLFLGGISFMSYQRKKKDHEIIAQQKHEVELQKEIVVEKNREITDSINYAKRIQEAILPNMEFFRKFFPDSFILYKPKDIVAGDFYWMEHVNEYVIFAVADCTGHGVPGAMVSVVCHNALNRSVKEFGLINANKILDKTRELVIDTFENNGDFNFSSSTQTIRDGMDIALCVFNTQTQSLEFSGANNGLYLLRENELAEYTADKQPIGKHTIEKPFTSQKIELKKGDLIYLFSDGYADQFGGPEGKKFKYKQLKDIIKKNAKLSLIEQQSDLNNSFEKWKGNLEQIDDVCLMGIRI